jgi:hypothetical protein
LRFTAHADGWLEVHDMPTLTAAKGKTELNHHRIFDIMQREGDEPQMCVLERVGARPGQGVTSMFDSAKSMERWKWP